MKINHLKVNGFGKLSEKEIKFENGINIVYGENEAGKSTLLKFISCMFYGTSRNKNGKNISDFEKYKPWKTEEYSGTIDYRLDNEEEYSVYREFKRKNPTVYDSEKQDITKTFKEDKNGIDFFTEQTGIDEETYFNTAISEQARVALNLNKQNSLIQKISNLVSTGDDNISFQKSMAQISKLQNENVGTERTSLRPLNVINNKIKLINLKKKELEENKNNYEHNNLGSEKLFFTLKNNEKKLEYIKRVKQFHENNRIKLVEINFNKNVAIEDEEKIDELIKKLNELEDNKESEQIIKKFPYVAISLFLIIIFVVLEILLPNKLFGLIPFICSIFVLIFMFVKINNEKNSIAKELLSKKNKLKFELDSLKDKKRRKEQEIDTKNSKIESEIDTEKDALIEEYLKVLDINFIDEILQKSYEEILVELEIFEKKVSDIKLDIKELELNKKAYNKKMEELSRITEDLMSAEEEKEELLSLNRAYNIAKRCLENAYEETKKNISPKFINNLSEIIFDISNKKYKEIVLNDEEGINVKIENGSYKPLERLSIGTIDQIYISLRLSGIKEVSKESVPIILDEAFAYFDNKRLLNIINYLNEHYSENQIIIFTCSNREKEVLEKLNIEYNFINLEK